MKDLTGIPLKEATRVLVIIFAFGLFNLTTGCRHYFKVTSSPKSTENISRLNDAGKMFIVHFNDEKWILLHAEVKNNTVSGKLNEYQLPPTLKPVRTDKKNRYTTDPDQRYLLNEVHIYLDKAPDNENGNTSIPVSTINRIELYDKDSGATAASWILPTIGVIGGIALIVALTKESCPFIYTWDGDNYNFAGEIYSGTIHKPLERNDYLKLPTYADQKSYTLKISNEAQEIQHTNLLELIVIDHPSNVNVLMDKYGNVITISRPLVPTKAVSQSGEKVTAQLSSKDKLIYQSSSNKAELPLNDAVVMEFPDQGDAKNARLVIYAKNSILLDYMIGQFYDLFGSSYKEFMEKQQVEPADNLRQWSFDQGIPLKLYIERYGKWDFLDYYNIAGPMKFKDDILSIPLKGNETHPLKVKLEFGNFLWEIDYAAIDYSAEQPVTIHTVPVGKAISEENINITELLAKEDMKYCDQLTTENQTIVTYKLPKPAGPSRTIILHSTGWYQMLRNPSGTPDMEYLRTFRQPGRFNQFVNEQVRIMEQKISQTQ